MEFQMLWCWRKKKHVFDRRLGWYFLGHIWKCDQPCHSIWFLELSPFHPIINLSRFYLPFTSSSTLTKCLPRSHLPLASYCLKFCWHSSFASIRTLFQFQLLVEVILVRLFNAANCTSDPLLKIPYSSFLIIQTF